MKPILLIFLEFEKEMFQSLVEDMLFPLNNTTTPQKTRFHHVFIHNSTAKKTILYAHDNNVTLPHILPLLQDLAHTVGCSVLAFEYPGYDVCAGECTRQTLNLAIKRAYEIVIDKHAAPEDVILMGRGVGCAPLLWLAEQLDAIDSAILISAFTSVKDMVLSYNGCGLQYFVNAFIDEVYDNETAIRSIGCPVLIIHGQQDNIVPAEMAERLFFACPSVYKRLHLIPDEKHNMWCFTEIDSFIRGLQTTL